MSAATWLVVVIVAVVIVIAAGWASQTANRLDRLNVRVDLARAAMFAALDRRTVVVRALAAWLGAHDADGAATAQALTERADVAEHAAPADREAAENALSVALARVRPDARPVALVAELADAETRILLARRFYNDAVRDTRGLAERPLVRRLRLGGHAELPEYFEISERITPGSGAADH
ncbi:MAG: NUDIX hydrolase [Gordonia sp. (in: high G+C Gram-positive bacteria)]